jgi:hypothetical protein
MALYIFRKKNILLNAYYNKGGTCGMFIASAILLGLGSVMTTLGLVFMIGWVIKKITE